MQQTERLLVLYKQEGTAGHLACGGSTLWPTADDHNRRITLGVRGSLDIPSHTQLTPYPWLLHHDSNQFVLICRTEGEGAETRGWAGRHELHQHQRTQDAKEKAACCSCPYNTTSM